MRKIAIWCPYMGHVGTVRAALNLAKGLADLGADTVLFKVYREWEGYGDFLAANRIRVDDFGASRRFKSLPRFGIGFRISMGILSVYSLPFLIRHLRKEKPDALVVCLLGFVPFLAVLLSGYRPKMLLSVQGKPHFNGFRKWLWNNFQTRADKVVLLSESSMDLVLKHTRLDRRKLCVINNPVIYDEIAQKSREPVEYGWLERREHQVIVGVGRHTRQKDFKTLIRAFAIIRSKKPCKLLLLGDGEERDELTALAAALGVSGDVVMAGFVQNPFKFMARSDVFVLSSLWEDNPHVLLEAAYLGIPIVSTRCPYGPSEFLEEGRLGGLCGIGDPSGMAESILARLGVDGKDPAAIEGAREKSLNYTIERSARRYYETLFGGNSLAGG
jgi:glycosyltransferase involved in cell wall biosynthesis